MKLDSIRLLYLPNGHQPGTSECFRDLFAEKGIAAYGEYDFLAKAVDDPCFTARADDILQLAASVRPNVILWQHIGDTPVSAGFLVRLRGAAPDARLVYQELDAWGGRAKRLTAPMVAMCRECDDLVLCGGGPFLKEFGPHLGKNARVHWMGHTVDDRWVQHGDPPGTAFPRKFDVVMVGNNLLPRWQWLRHVPRLAMPGAANRCMAVKAVSAAFGNRVAIYGDGWLGVPGAVGPIPFERQLAAQREGWVSAMWNLYDNVPFYYSNRPVIAMLSGVPHVTNYQPGYEVVFGPNGQNMFWAGSVSEFVDTVRFLLSRSREELVEIGARARLFAREHLHARTAYRGLLINLEVSR